MGASGRGGQESWKRVNHCEKGMMKEKCRPGVNLSERGEGSFDGRERYGTLFNRYLPGLILSGD